jgi:hypothetical protein
MSVEPIRLVCGNEQCRAALLIKNPDKLRDAKCPRCGYINPIPRQVAPEPDDRTMLNGFMPAPEPPPPPNRLGWLVIKDELTQTATFTLRMGTNTVGRQSAKWPSDHMIETRDEFMSRPHCTIEVRLGKLGLPEYLLRDGASANGKWKFSTNGTYLNGKEPRLSQYDKVFLEDGDTIQLGETKLVFKMGSHSTTRQQATRAVEDMDYERTVVSFKPQSSTT